MTTVKRNIPNLKIDVEVDGIRYRLHPAKEASINVDDLDTEFSNLPRELTKWYMLRSRMEGEIRRLTQERKRVYARESFRVRIEFKAAKQLDSGFKGTEKMVDDTIRTADLHMEVTGKLLRCQQAMDFIDSGVKGLEAKKTMLVSLGANARRVMGAAIVSKEKEEEQRIKKKAAKDKIKRRKKIKKEG